MARRKDLDAETLSASPLPPPAHSHAHSTPTPRATSTVTPSRPHPPLSYYPSSPGTTASKSPNSPDSQATSSDSQQAASSSPSSSSTVHPLTLVWAGPRHHHHHHRNRPHRHVRKTTERGRESGRGRVWAATRGSCSTSAKQYPSPTNPRTSPCCSDSSRRDRRPQATPHRPNSDPIR